jgi:hypothetical protein
MRESNKDIYFRSGDDLDSAFNPTARGGIVWLYYILNFSKAKLKYSDYIYGAVKTGAPRRDK